MSRIVSFLVLIGVIAVISVLFYHVMAGFLLPLFLALTMVVVFRPLHLWFIAKCHGRDRLAAGLTTATAMSIVFFPAVLTITLAIDEARDVTVTYFRDTKITTQAKQTNENNKGSTSRLDGLRRRLGLTIPQRQQIQTIELTLGTWLEKTNLTASKKRIHFQKASIKAFQNSAQELGKYVQDQSPNNTNVAAEASDNKVQTKWHHCELRFEKIFTQLRKLQTKYHPNDTNRANDDPDRHQERDVIFFLSDLDDINLTLGDDIHLALEEMRSFKTELFGGTMLARFKEFANPDPQQLWAFGRRVFEEIRPKLVSVGGEAVVFAWRLIMGTIIMTVSMYFFLADGRGMVNTVMRLSPLSDAYEEELIGEFDRISRAVVVATLLSAIAQGILAGIGYFFAGVESLFLWTLITMVMAMVPFLGAASVWLPISLWLCFVNDQWFAGVLLAVYGSLVVSMADNLIKPWVLHGQSNLHPLLALLSVLGGVSAMGPIGILVGPMVVTFLQTLLGILQRELSSLDDKHGETTEGEHHQDDAGNDRMEIEDIANSEHPEDADDHDLSE